MKSNVNQMILLVVIQNVIKQRSTFLDGQAPIEAITFSLKRSRVAKRGGPANHCARNLRSASVETA